MPFRPHDRLLCPDSGGAATGAGRWAGVLDSQALDRLGELDPTGSAGLIARVVTTYTNSLSRLIENFDVACSTGDLDGARHVAHTLKSSSASVGAMALSSLCAELERGIREGRIDRASPLLGQLAAEARRVLAGLRGADPAAGSPGA
jgi:HPt (histidine-containing phosphotransfer) domain-containing protein